MWSTGREVTQDSGSAWVRTEGKRLITEEENGVGRPQGQAGSNWSTLPVAALILVTFLIVVTKIQDKKQFKERVCSGLHSITAGPTGRRERVARPLNLKEQRATFSSKALPAKYSPAFQNSVTN